MASKKVGELIREARTAAGLTQEKLAKQAGEGLTAGEIGKCERGQIDLTGAQLKKIAVACGVTQASLLNAPKNLAAAKAGAKTTAAKTTAAKTAAKKTETKTAAAGKAGAKTTTAKTTTAKTAEKKTASAAKKPQTAETTVSMKVTAAEKKLLEAYRKASTDRKKVALKALKGDYDEKLDELTGKKSGDVVSTVADGISGVLGDLLGGLLK